ncbi:hypothetical protein ACFQL4_20215 [Halosimplex aquaticum]
MNFLHGVVGGELDEVDVEVTGALGRELDGVLPVGSLDVRDRAADVLVAALLVEFERRFVALPLVVDLHVGRREHVAVEGRDRYRHRVDVAADREPQIVPERPVVGEDDALPEPARRRRVVDRDPRVAHGAVGRLPAGHPSPSERCSKPTPASVTGSHGNGSVSWRSTS